MLRWRSCVVALLAVSLLSCQALPGGSSQPSDDPLFEAFRDPPAEARPFVRWWWNGNRLAADEIVREIELMEAAGLGGFEINPIARPGGPDLDVDALEWPGPGWVRMVRAATDAARQRGLLADLIVGSGWPFGTEDLPPSERLQILRTRRLPLEGGGTRRWETQELVSLATAGPQPAPGGAEPDTAEPPGRELLYVTLSPGAPGGLEDMEDLTDRIGADGTLEVTVPEGPHALHVGVVERGFATVTHGAPGASGPVLDHYDAAAVRSYLDRLSRSLGPALGGRLGDALRSAFVDSVELSRANWTDDLEAEFRQRRGYELRPWLPFVGDFRHEPRVREPLAASVPRVRYDLARTLIEIFQERFVATFIDWAHGQGVEARIQAYGFPWLRGMLEGYLAADIPEGNNWLRIVDPYGHGHDVWSNYAASAGHLAGRSVISTEAMTNTSGVFRASLEEIKAADDLNFLRGISHSVLHGFNYSPPEAGFPGWVRFGTFFSEHNTWWRHLRLWTRYNARLSAVWQGTRPVVQVAVLAPRADAWSLHGLERRPFQTEPWYAHRLWESMSQNGVAADFVSEEVVRSASVEGGRLGYGPMGYELLVVAGARRLEPETAEAIARLAEAGGRIAFVGTVPDRSPGSATRTPTTAASAKRWPGPAGDLSPDVSSTSRSRRAARRR